MRFLYKDIEIDYTFVDKGTNITNVYLHGWGGNQNIFKWVADTSTLNTLNLDLPPFGNSQEPKEAWTLDTYVDMLNELTKHLGLDKLNLIVHSFGGRMALRLASTTDKVNKMVLTDIAGIGRKSVIDYLKIANYKWKKFLAKIGLLDDWFVGKTGSEDYVTLSDTMKQTFNQIIKVNQRKELAKISAPCLVVWGRDDNDTTLKCGKYLAKHLKAELVVFNGGHYAFLENREQYLDKINNFLGS